MGRLSIRYFPLCLVPFLVLRLVLRLVFLFLLATLFGPRAPPPGLGLGVFSMALNTLPIYLRWLGSRFHLREDCPDGMVTPLGNFPNPAKFAIRWLGPYE
jgi:hypothetical protein